MKKCPSYILLKSMYVRARIGYVTALNVQLSYTLPAVGQGCTMHEATQTFQPLTAPHLPALSSLSTLC